MSKRLPPPDGCRTGTSRLLSGVAAVAICLAVPHPVAAQAGTPAGALEVRVVTVAGGPVTGALVTVWLLPDSATVRNGETDRAGRVMFVDVVPGVYALSGERLGYEAAEGAAVVLANRTTRVALAMREVAVGLPGVVVEAERRRARFEESAGATVGELTQRDLKLLPAAGEADVLRAVEVLPGVISTSDFSSSFNVRGGSADQNLILLDGIPIYNPFHLGGVFSVFNADMVARAELMSGGFPAQYGGRVSSVLSIDSDAGGAGTDVQAGVSLLATRVAVGVDLPESVLNSAGLRAGRARLSVRRSYFDQLFRPFFDFPYHLTDVQGYAEAWLNGGSRATLTGYTGRDVLDLTSTESFPLKVHWDWGNDALGGSWTGGLGRGRELTVRAGHTRFRTGIRFPEFDDTEFRSAIDQSLLRLDYTASGSAVTVGAGAAADRLWYDNLAQAGGTVFGAGAGRGWLLGAYVQTGWQPKDWIVETGLRLDGWLAAGEGDAIAFQPRVAVKRFFGGRDYALKLAAGRYAQFAHSLRDEEIPLGIDVWALTGERAPHVVSDQVQAGLEGYVGGSWFGAVETYVRRFSGVAAVNPAEDPNDPLDDLLEGRGLSYGTDLHVRREAGRIRPMLAVSWLRAWREFDDVLGGEMPPPRLRYAPIFDRRVDVDLVLQAMLPRRIELGIRWNLGTGLPYTRPVGAHVYYDYRVLEGARWRSLRSDGDSLSSAIVLGPRNAERYPTYHRLDIGLRRTFVKGWGTMTPHFDLLNAYDRRNVLFYFYDYGVNPPLRSGISMFPLLPTAGLEVRF
ncbi:TonB-dependent receptor [soil metagenome]